MTTTTNNKISANTATQNTNNMTEDGTMNHANDNNITMVTRISNVLRMGSISKLAVTAAVGLALTIGIAMPGSASADIPSVTNVGSQLAANHNDDFSLVFGTFDTIA